VPFDVVERKKENVPPRNIGDRLSMSLKNLVPFADFENRLKTMVRYHFCSPSFNAYQSLSSA
jgi:hypothetical protein